MTMLSVVVLALLAAAQCHAMEFPSRSVGGLGRTQKRHASLNAAVLSSAQATVRSIPENIERWQTSYEASPSRPGVEIMQDAACVEAMAEPCLTAAVAMLLAINLAAAANDSVTAVTEQCAACGDNLEAQYEAAATACELAGDDLTAHNEMRDVVETLCADPECTGNFAFAATQEDMDRDLLCPNLECGLPVLMAGASIDPTATEEATECLSATLSSMCITDQSNSTIYCNDLYMTAMQNSIAPFCETSCPGDYGESLAALSECMVTMGEGLLDDDGGDDECHEEGESLLDDHEGMNPLPAMCIQNADEEYCVELEPETDVSACPAELFGDAVPAPGAEVEAPTECVEACSTQLQAFVDDVGCCAGSMIEMMCTAEREVLTTFINSTCGVAVEACVVPTFATSPPEMTDSPTDGEPTSDVVVHGVSVAVASVLAVVAFVLF